MLEYSNSTGEAGNVTQRPFSEGQWAEQVPVDSGAVSTSCVEELRHERDLISWVLKGSGNFQCGRGPRDSERIGFCTSNWSTSGEPCNGLRSHFVIVGITRRQ